MSKEVRVRGFLALFNCSLLILSVLAVSFLISESGVVSSQEYSRFMDFSGVNAKQEAQKSAAILGTQHSGTLYNTGNAAEAKGIIQIGSDAVDVDKISGVSQSTQGYQLLGENGEGLLSTPLTESEFPIFQKGLAEKGVSLTKGYTTEYPLIGKIGVGWSHLVDGIVWAGLVAAAIQFIFPLLGAEDELTNAATIAAVAGIMTYQGLQALGPTGFNFIADPSSVFLQYAPGIGLAVAAVTFVLLYKKESKKVVELQCLPWEAPLGGNDCEKCNQDPTKPCSEYRCKSLGQACELVNQGTNEERCTWVSRNDVNSPTITPWKEALSDGHEYTKHDTRPPSLGTKILSNSVGGCILPFTPLEFGVVLNEPGQCKIDYVRANGTKAFEEMKFYFGESNLYRYNHTEKLRLPSPAAFDGAAEAAGAPELKNDGNYNLYVRCRDANGNVNVDDFVFNFCVDKSPDTTPPVIESTSIIDGSPVSFGVQNLSISAFVNEPAECKWSLQDKSYDNMENAMSCSTQIYEQNARQLYPCTTMLNGIKDMENNAFYFRCKDQPGKAENERNVNSQSYVLNLKGSQLLNILKVSPNETIKDNTDAVEVNLEVETSNGAENGKAACYFSPTGKEDYVLMFETNSIMHKQMLSLGAGNYNYFFRCIDAGGNADSANTSFSVVIDRQAPFVTRVYKQEPDALKLVTNEDAECAYSINSCNFNFEEGLPFIYNPIDIKNNHFVKWENNRMYYIKCRDSYGNQPAPNSCSVVVNAAQLT